MVLAQIWLKKFQLRCAELQPFLSTLCVFDKYVHVCVCVHEWLLVHVCHDMWMELRDWSLPFTLFKTGPRLSAWILHVFWVLNSSSHACWQTLLINFPTQLPTQLVYLHGWQSVSGTSVRSLATVTSRTWLLAFMAWLLGSPEDYDPRWKEGNYKD